MFCGNVRAMVALHSKCFVSFGAWLAYELILENCLTAEPHKHIRPTCILVRSTALLCVYKFITHTQFQISCARRQSERDREQCDDPEYEQYTSGVTVIHCVLVIWLCHLLPAAHVKWD